MSELGEFLAGIVSGGALMPALGIAWLVRLREWLALTGLRTSIG